MNIFFPVIKKSIENFVGGYYLTIKVSTTYIKFIIKNQVPAILENQFLVMTK